MTLKITDAPDTRTLKEMLDSINEVAVTLDYMACRAIQEDLAAIWKNYNGGGRKFVCSDCGATLTLKNGDIVVAEEQNGQTLTEFDLRRSITFCPLCGKRMTEKKAEPVAAWILACDDPYTILKCSKCGYIRETEKCPPFCEHCGAKMYGGKTDG